MTSIWLVQCKDFILSNTFNILSKTRFLDKIWYAYQSPVPCCFIIKKFGNSYVALSFRDYLQKKLTYRWHQYLDIELKISDQECHVLSNMPHWPKTLASLLRYWAVQTVIATLGKICVILMHHRSPWFLQFHLRTFQP